MLWKKERLQVKSREAEILKKVENDLKTLRTIDTQYAKRILAIFYNPENQWNSSYVRKILENKEKLGIQTQIRDNMHYFWDLQIKRNIRSAERATNIWWIFITNPIKNRYDQEEYQEAVNRTNTKDIDGQYKEHKQRVAELHQTLTWTIVHPTALSVLLLTQKTLETRDLNGKIILVAWKDWNFGSMIAALLQRAWAQVRWFNPKSDQIQTRYSNIKDAHAVVSVIRWAQFFKNDHFDWFNWPIIDVTTENNGNGKTVGSVDTLSCKDLPNIYVPSINGGVGTITSALLMSNFPRCIINTEIAKWVDPKVFEDLKAIQTYEDFWINNISPLYQRWIETFGTKENFEQRLNTPNFYLNNQTPKEQDTATIMDMITRIEHGIPW